MKKRKLGRTGLEISEIGFGCGMMAGLMTRNAEEAGEEQRAAVMRALELGINYFDTAPVYGNTVSETNLGNVLVGLRARPIVATKVALEPGDLGDIYGSVIRSVEASLQRLGPIDIIQLHNRVGRERAPKPDIGTGAQLSVEDVLGAGGVVEAFTALRIQGKVSFFGCCAFGGENDCVAQLIDSNAFDTVLLHYSPANPTAWQPAPGVRDYGRIGARAAERGMGTVAVRVLDAGKSTSPEASIRFALANPELSTALIGFSNIRQVEQAAKAAGA